jgi:hypothetical protein
MLSSGRISREIRQHGFAALSLRVVPDFAATPRNGEGSLSGCRVYHANDSTCSSTSTSTGMFIVNRCVASPATPIRPRVGSPNRSHKTTHFRDNGHAGHHTYIIPALVDLLFFCGHIFYPTRLAHWRHRGRDFGRVLKCVPIFIWSRFDRCSKAPHAA